MKRTRLVSLVLGLVTMVVVAFFGATWSGSHEGDDEEHGTLLAQARRQPLPAKDRTQEKPINMPASPVSVELFVGLKDEQPTNWQGEVEVTGGKLLEIDVLRGGPNARVTGGRFNVRTTRQNANMPRQRPQAAVLHISLDAPPAAELTIKAADQTFKVTLGDIPDDTAKQFLDGMVSVQRQEAGVRLTSRSTEDDYPAIARGPDGTLWLAYVEYTPGPPVVNERILAGNFEGLVPQGNGDQIRLMRFDGKTWQPPIDVTGGGLDIWRPTVAVDPTGVVTIAWSQQVNNDWEIFYRRYTPPSPPLPKGGAGRGRGGQVVGHHPADEVARVRFPRRLHGRFQGLCLAGVAGVAAGQLRDSRDVPWRRWAVDALPRQRQQG